MFGTKLRHRPLVLTLSDLERWKRRQAEEQREMTEYKSRKEKKGTDLGVTVLEFNVPPFALF